MTYDWTVYAPEGYDPESTCALFLDERVSEMSPKEWRIFRAAADLNRPDSLTFLAALTYSLHEFEFYYPAFDDASLGKQLAEFNYGVRSDLMPFLNMAEVGKRYRQEHDGEYIDGAYVTQCSTAALDRIKLKAESIEDFGLPTDESWSAKLRIAGPGGKEVWLRLPDWEEVNGGQADEVQEALDDLGVATLDECTLLEAKCIFPQIDLMSQYDDLKKLVFEASNLGYALAEENQNEPHFRRKLWAAMDYEQCDRLDFAIDITANLDCYDFVPDSIVETTGENLLPEKHLKQPAIMDALDVEGYAVHHYLSQGMQRVEGGFFMRNDQPFQYMYSMEPEKRAQAQHHDELVRALNARLEENWRDFEEDSLSDPIEVIFQRAGIISTTEATYHGFKDSKSLPDEAMEQLLRFENPLEIARDAWSECTGIDDPDVVASYLGGILNDPDVGRSYDLLPEFSGKPEQYSSHQQMMGGM